MIIEYNTGAGWLFYAATSLLSFAIVPDKLEILPYVFFFGIYGLIKFYIELIKNIVFEYILKLFYFNICLFAAWYLVKLVFAAVIAVKLPLWALIAVLETGFLVYDYAYTLFIVYYRQSLRKILKL